MPSPQEDQIGSLQLPHLVKQILAREGTPEYAGVTPPFSPEQLWARDRIFAVMHVVQRMFSDTPKILMSVGGLTSISNAAQYIENEFQAFAADNNPARIITAVTHVDTIVSTLWAFGPPISDTSALQIISGVRSASERSIKEIGDESAKVKDEIRSGANATIDSIKAERDQISSSLTTFSTSLATLTSQVSELTTQVNQQRQDASVVVSDLITKYKESDADFKKQFADTIANLNLDFGVFQANSKDAADKFLAALEAARGQAEKIVQVVGNIGATGNYQKIANDEARQANIFRRATVFFLGLAVTVALGSFLLHLFPDLFPGIAADGFWSFVGRFITAVAISLPAYYTAQESARHRTNSDRARQMELELASIGPFIALLPESIKEEITKQMVDRYFGREVQQHEIKTAFETKDIASIVKSIPAVIKAIKT